MANAKSNKKKILLAYLYDKGGWDGSKMEVSKLTHVNYAFGVIRDGRVVGNNWVKVHWIREFKKRNPELKVLLSVGGWSAEGFSDASLTDESRNLFADTAVALIQEHGFDGLDLDWEYPTRDFAGIVARPEDRQNYTLLVQLLRRRLDALAKQTGAVYELTMAAGAAKMFAEDIELEKLVPEFDFINLMTYDLHNGVSKTAGHHTNLYDSKNTPGISSAQAVEDFIAGGVPAEKLVLGTAFYARGWSGLDSSKEPVGEPGKPGISYSYAKLGEVMNRNGFRRLWDEDAKAPYLWNGDTFLTYDDPESLRHKVQYVKDQGLGGLMFWEWSSDKDNELLDAIYNALY
jgi:chitinase